MLGEWVIVRVNSEMKGGRPRMLRKEVRRRNINRILNLTARNLLGKVERILGINARIGRGRIRHGGLENKTSLGVSFDSLMSSKGTSIIKLNPQKAVVAAHGKRTVKR